MVAVAGGVRKIVITIVAIVQVIRPVSVVRFLMAKLRRNTPSFEIEMPIVVVAMRGAGHGSPLAFHHTARAVVGAVCSSIRSRGMRDGAAVLLIGHGATLEHIDVVPFATVGVFDDIGMLASHPLAIALANFG